VLLVFQWLGTVAGRAADIALTGPLLGMLMLLVVLTVYGRPLEFLDRASNLLIQHLSLMFIAPSVGAFFLSQQIYQQFPSLLATILLSTVAAIVFMAWLIRVLPGPSKSRPD
jgi:holin-like protein